MIALTWDQVASWHLARQHLLPRAAPAQLLTVVAQVGGMQAQVMSAAELALWARIDGLASGAVREALWVARSLVKIWAMRGTLHLLPAGEFPLYIAAAQTKGSRRSAGWFKYHGVTPAELEAITAGVPRALDGQCLTREQLAATIAEQAGVPHLRDLLLSGWGALLKPAAYQGDLCFGPSQGQAVTFVRPDQWLGPWHARESGPALQEILRRFLRAYGPGTREDFAHWWGVQPAEVRPAFAGLAAELEEVTVEGAKVWALAATLPDLQQQPAPTVVRLLPHFDPYVIAAHTYRRFLVADEFKPRVYRTAGWVSPVVLAAGRIAGVWQYEKARDHVQVRADLWAPLTAALRQGLEAEVARLGAYLDAPAELVFGAA